MKTLILIGGTMGVGKTTTCRELQKLLPDNVFLDGDWCWDMKPFVVDSETKEMVMDNICHLLNNFLRCSKYQNIVFCWVMHQQAIWDDLLSRLDTRACRVKRFSLIADQAALEKRLIGDIEKGVRTRDILQRSVERIVCYATLQTEKIDVSNITPQEAAEEICRRL